METAIENRLRSGGVVAAGVAPRRAEHKAWVFVFPFERRPFERAGGGGAEYEHPTHARRYMNAAKPQRFVVGRFEVAVQSLPGPYEPRDVQGTVVDTLDAVTDAVRTLGADPESLDSPWRVSYPLLSIPLMPGWYGCGPAPRD